MRDARLDDAWNRLEKGQKSTLRPLSIGHGDHSYTTSGPSLVIGGLNGSGKSRALKTLADSIGSTAILVPLHTLCEQVLATLRSRSDFAEMAEESGMKVVNGEMLDCIQGIVGRDYDALTWSTLEIEPTEAGEISDLLHFEDHIRIPYFTASSCAVNYSSLSMGLGEFSTSLLFWLLEMNREQKGLVLLLDEPDSYLAPPSSKRLLNYLLDYCLKREWRLVMSTHSPAIVASAHAHHSFVRLVFNNDGLTVPIDSRLDSSALDGFLEGPSVRNVFICEDESAHSLLSGILRFADATFTHASIVLWANGHGDLTALRGHFPRNVQNSLDFFCVYDGDMRSSDQIKTGRTTHVLPPFFLPTDRDPDTLFRASMESSSLLASRLGCEPNALQQANELAAGSDAHDWVNSICHRFGRAHTLQTLADVWCESHSDLVGEFLNSINAPLK